MATVLRWLTEDDKTAFKDQYMRARGAGGFYGRGHSGHCRRRVHHGEGRQARLKRRRREEHGRGVDPTSVARNRLRVDARKWLASKMAPKKYGDKIEAVHTGPDGGALQIASTVTFVRPQVRKED